jgi:ATP-dependent exoDNAse (exonuclease V) beta subunit
MLILGPGSSFAFSHILALTFTNKAVNEMKQRILSSLTDFSTQPLPKKSESIFNEVAQALFIDHASLQKKAKQVLQQLLHNYAFFEVSTIDKFNHRIIRTFAKDLKLPQNFEVQLDTGLILRAAVDSLLDRVGQDVLLTEIMVAFALEKIAEDKSWDLSFDLMSIGKLLFNDLDIEALAALSHKKLTDFEALKQKLKKEREKTSALAVSAAEEIKTLISKNGLEHKDFSGAYLPKFIDKITDKQTPETSGKWLTEFDEKNPYAASRPEATKVIIDSIKPDISRYLKIILEGLSQKSFFENAYKNLLPLNLINALQYQVKQLCEKRDYLPISEFNRLIKGALKEQSVPFIYERIGEQYQHFFIDEFQDTSALQWHNLKPLIENSLVSEDVSGNKGSLLLVGDAKQSIYRWRGGSAMQFIALCEGTESAFSGLPPQVIQLPKNYRSLAEIVRFNNNFFGYISNFLSRDNFSALYKNSSEQEAEKKEGGYVSLHFLDVPKEEKKDAYCKEVLKTVLMAQSKGYELGDLCILTRKKTEGSLLAAYLLAQDIAVVSSESLLINSHPKVQFLIGLIQYTHREEAAYLAYPLLEFLGERQSKMPLHPFIAEHLLHTERCFLKNYGFDSSLLSPEKLYDFCVYAISCFKLNDGKDAYLQFFLEVVAEVEIKKGGGVHEFLAYWEEKKDSLSISAPEGLNAVQILTIHKAKGLEFPVVIYPFVETPLYDEKMPKLWVPVPEKEYCGFDHVLLNKNEKLASFSPLTEQLIKEEDEKLALDAINLLYVALTRAEKALFIIGAKAINAKGEINTKQYSGVLIDYLNNIQLWNDNQLEYCFGAFEPVVTPHHRSAPTPIPFQESEKHKGSFALLLHPEINQPAHLKEAQIKGQQLHLLLDVLERFSMEDALLKVLVAFPNAIVSSLEKQALNLMQHPLLKPYYKKGVRALNEIEIFGADGLTSRPDRLVFEGNEVTLIDYKTGIEKTEDYQQIDNYGVLITEMGYQLKNKILVYISKDYIDPIFVT